MNIHPLGHGLLANFTVAETIVGLDGHLNTNYTSRPINSHLITTQYTRTFIGRRGVKEASLNGYNYELIQ